MLSSMRDPRGRPNNRTRLLLYVVVATVLSPVVIAIFLGGDYGLFGYPF